MKALTFFILTISAMSYELECHTPNLEHEFTIKDKAVVFHQKSHSIGFDSKRKISSTNKVKSIKTQKGVKKSLKFNGKHYKIEISDLSKLNSINDYVTISMSKKYKVSYPLNCTKKK